jgi:hypothetical protein
LRTIDCLSFLLLLLVTATLTSCTNGQATQPDYRAKLDYRFTIESDTIKMEVDYVLFPAIAYRSWTDYAPPGSRNITALDFSSKKTLQIKTENAGGGWTSVLILFNKDEYKGYEFSLSYTFEPNSWNGGGTGYPHFFHWKYGNFTETTVGTKETHFFTCPQNITVVLPSGYVVDRAVEGQSTSAIPLNLQTAEEAGRVVCKFSGVAPKQGYFEWYVFYKQTSQQTSTATQSQMPTAIQIPTPTITLPTQTSTPNSQSAVTLTSSQNVMEQWLPFVLIVIIIIVVCGILIIRRRTASRADTSATPSPSITQEPIVQEARKEEFCYYCGASMPSGSKYCKKCGKSQA